MHRLLSCKTTGLNTDDLRLLRCETLAWWLCQADSSHIPDINRKYEVETGHGNSAESDEGQ